MLERKEKLDLLNTKSKKMKMLYQWIKQDVITFKEFESLSDMVFSEYGKFDIY